MTRYRRVKRLQLRKYARKYGFERPEHFRLNLKNRRLKASLLRKVYDLEALRKAQVR